MVDVLVERVIGVFLGLEKHMILTAGASRFDSEATFLEACDPLKGRILHLRGNIVNLQRLIMLQ